MECMKNNEEYAISARIDMKRNVLCYHWGHVIWSRFYRCRLIAVVSEFSESSGYSNDILENVKSRMVTG